MFSIRYDIAAALRGADKPRSSELAPLQPLGHGLLTMVLVLGMSAAHAQVQTNTSAGEKAANLEEITVTGSRIKKSNDFDPATPTTVVDSTYLENLSITNVGEALTQLPSNISTFQPSTTGNSNFFAGSIIPNLRGLNPYFGSRTLTLVDGQRFVPTNQGDGLDLNFIPSVLIDHLDVVTGGASAAYGSGAVAGVVNTVLNRKLEGGKFVADYGETQKQDDKDRHIGAAYGLSMIDGRAHLVVGGEWEKIGNATCEVRSWCAQGNGLYPVSGYPPNSYALGNNLRYTQISQTGTYFNGAPGAAATLQANAAGTGLVPYGIGLQPESATGPFNNFPGGDGGSIYNHTNLIAPTERYVFDGLFSMALTDKVNFKFDGSWGQVKTVTDNAAVTSYFVNIQPDNAYTTLNPALTSPTANPFFNPLDKQWDSQSDPFSKVESTVWRMVGGLDGAFGDTSWTWDGYYEFGHTYRTQLVHDNIHLNETNLALDSVLVGGVPECRSTATGVYPAGYTADPTLANGCQPLDPFGSAPIPAATKAYVFGDLVEQLTYEQNVAALNATGNLFDGFGAGPVSAAIGAEYRRERGDNVDNPGVPANVASDYLIQYGSSFAGRVTVEEGYLESNIPLLKDLPFAHRLDVDVAARESHYNNQGLAGTSGIDATHNIFTWKVSANYEPVDWLRFRGSQSHDARAANFRELYYQQLIGAGGLFGYCAPGNTQPCSWSLEGNANLNPEQSDTTTLGFVLTPRDVMPGFQFAADYFRINIKQAIQQANVQAVLAGCQTEGIAADCALLTPAPGSPPGNYTDIVHVTALATNGSGYVYKGVDLTGSYNIDLAAAGSLDFRLLATRMLLQDYQPNPGGPYVNIVGQTGQGNSFVADFQPTAKWAANFTSTYSIGPFSTTGQVRYVSQGEFNYNGLALGTTPPTGNYAISDNHVPSYFLFNLNAAFKLPPVNNFNMTVFGGINNLFDKVPPVAVGVGGFGATNGYGGTNPVFFDTFGRTFKIGIRATF